MKDKTKIIILLGMLPLFITARAFVICKLWGWFIVTTFEAPQISIPVAYGISLLFNVFYSNEAKKEDDVFTMITTFFLELGFSLFIGWVATLLM